MKNRQLELAAETKEKRDRMLNQNITVDSGGQLTPTLSLPGLADFVEAVYPQLEMLGPWPSLCAWELIHAVQEWEKEASR